MTAPARRLLILSLSLLPAVAAADEEPPKSVFYGLEVFSGYRTTYEFRNFRLADHVVELQAGTQVAVSNDLSLSLGAYAAHGEAGFTESSAFFDLRYLFREGTTLGLSNSWRNYDGGPLQDTYEFGAFIEQELPANLSLRLGHLTDSGASGTYSSLELDHTHQFTRELSLHSRIGTSYTNSYYGRDGWNDISARVRLRYRFDATWSISPYLGSSFGLNDEGQDTVYAGIDLEFLF